MFSDSIKGTHTLRDATADVHGGDLRSSAAGLRGRSFVTLSGSSSTSGGASSGSSGRSVVDDDTDTGATLTSTELDDRALGQGVLGVLKSSVESLEVTLGLGALSLAGSNFLAHTLQGGDGSSCQSVSKVKLQTDPWF